jgi:hypothetical protein
MKTNVKFCFKYWKNSASIWLKIACTISISQDIFNILILHRKKNYITKKKILAILKQWKHIRVQLQKVLTPLWSTIGNSHKWKRWEVCLNAVAKVFKTSTMCCISLHSNRKLFSLELYFNFKIRRKEKFYHNSRKMF